MGEMIKFGIKLALIVGIALAIIAALLILYNLVGDAIVLATNSSTILRYIYDISMVISIVFPINLPVLFTTISSLFAFKIAYWAQDKLIPLLDAAG